jgi:peroxiredoxin
MALENDTRAPDFELLDQYGESVRLSSFRGKRPVAVVFVPLAFSGICTNEMCALSENLGMFADAGVELLAISVDSTFSLRAWGEKEKFPFRLLADFWPHGQVAKEYGVFLPERGQANRATFLIDVDGIIRASFITAPGEARDIQAYRTALREMQRVPA